MPRRQAPLRPWRILIQIEVRFVTHPSSSASADPGSEGPAAAGGGLLLADNGASRYRIVLSQSASPSDWCRQATDRFFAVAERAGITHIRESSRPQSAMDDFRRESEAGSRRQEGDGAEIE